jgi:hypothetical protein
MAIGPLQRLVRVAGEDKHRRVSVRGSGAEQRLAYSTSAMVLNAPRRRLWWTGCIRLVQADEGLHQRSPRRSRRYRAGRDAIEWEALGEPHRVLRLGIAVGIARGAIPAVIHPRGATYHFVHLLGLDPPVAAPPTGRDLPFGQ